MVLLDGLFPSFLYLQSRLAFLISDVTMFLCLLYRSLFISFGDWTHWWKSLSLFVIAFLISFVIQSFELCCCRILIAVRGANLSTHSSMVFEIFSAKLSHSGSSFLNFWSDRNKKFNEFSPFIFISS